MKKNNLDVDLDALSAELEGWLEADEKVINAIFPPIVAGPYGLKRIKSLKGTIKTDKGRSKVVTVMLAKPTLVGR